MLDLQIVRRARPAIDIAYILCSSTHYDLRHNNREEILSFYHSHLTNELKRLGYSESLHTYEAFREDFEEARAWGIMMGSMHGIVSD